MITVIKIILIYSLVLNAITFVMYGMDKWKARHDRWRIPESTLIWMAILGGSIGALLGIRLWHHKTLHAKFRYGVPAILIAQLTTLLAIYLLTINYCYLFPVPCSLLTVNFSLFYA